MEVTQNNRVEKKFSNKASYSEIKSAMTRIPPKHNLKGNDQHKSMKGSIYFSLLK